MMIIKNKASNSVVMSCPTFGSRKKPWWSGIGNQDALKWEADSSLPDDLTRQLLHVTTAHSLTQPSFPSKTQARSVTYVEKLQFSACRTRSRSRFSSVRATEGEASTAYSTLTPCWDSPSTRRTKVAVHFNTPGNTMSKYLVNIRGVMIINMC